MRKEDKKKLRLWQERLSRNDSAYSGELAKMDAREARYAGTDKINAMVKGEKTEKTPHVRNICAELIEAQTGSSIPQPKVTAQYRKDAPKAKLIEDMIRNELDRMPFELINDMMERTVPIQGGAAFLLEWDNTLRTHTTIGELTVSVLHPKQIIPQDGIFTGIEDMDYIILKVPQTKEYIRRRYGVSVEDEAEEEPEIKGSEGQSTAEDVVTQYIAYYRNENGGIGIYSWVGDIQLEDMEDYQARRLRRCAVCGAVEPLEPVEILGTPTFDGSKPSDIKEDEIGAENREKCPYCGAEKWESSVEEYEEVYQPIRKTDGEIIPGATMREEISDTESNLHGMPVSEIVTTPTKIPFYKPDIYPIILQKNVSVYGKFLGESDIDKIETQQNTTNRIEAKIIDKLLKSGSYITLPDSARISVDTEDMKVIRPGDHSTKALIDVYDLQGNIQQDMQYLSQVYEEARQIIGITDSFQGRADRTATSGRAKEFAAAQSAGRLESKRVMKNAAYAQLFEAIFKFKLAYADEPRAVISQDTKGDTVYSEFNRYDFLEKDSTGQWYWNDKFLFSCDSTAPLASNREAMWQETRMNFETGAFGNPQDMETLILFWQKMQMLHYPGAAETKKYLENRLQQTVAQAVTAQRGMLAQQVLMQQAMAQQTPRPMNEREFLQQAEQGNREYETPEAVIEKARLDALAAVKNR